MSNAAAEQRGNSGNPTAARGNSGNNGNNCKYIFPGLHSCLTAQNPEGRPHTLAYVTDVNTTEISASFSSRRPLRAADAVALYMSHTITAASSASARCVCCAAAFKVSLEDVAPYDAEDMLKPRYSAFICTTCPPLRAPSALRGSAAPPSAGDNDDRNFFVCSECTRLTQEALHEAKKCVGGAFGISRSLHLKDIIAFHLFLQRIDASIARAFLVFPAQVGFNTTIYQGTAASVDYVEALSIFNRARHADIKVKPTTSTTAAIIYTSFHTFFVTQKCLSIATAARASVDSAITAAKAAKTASKTASSMPPAFGGASLSPRSGAAALQERKRKRDESRYTCRGLDMEIRLADAHRLNMTLAIEKIRAVLRSRD